MRKPRKKWGHGKDCAGKPTRWLCQWTRHEETCGECGHHQGWGDWYDGAAFVAENHHDYRRGRCVRCGEKRPDTSSIGSSPWTFPFYYGANVRLVGITDEEIEG